MDVGLVPVLGVDVDTGREGEPEVDVLSGTDLVPDESVASVVAGLDKHSGICSSMSSNDIQLSWGTKSLYREDLSCRKFPLHPLLT